MVRCDSSSAIHVSSSRSAAFLPFASTTLVVFGYFCFCLPFESSTGWPSLSNAGSDGRFTHSWKRPRTGTPFFLTG